MGERSFRLLHQPIQTAAQSPNATQPPATDPSLTVPDVGPAVLEPEGVDAEEEADEGVEVFVVVLGWK